MHVCPGELAFEVRPHSCCCGKINQKVIGVGCFSQALVEVNEGTELEAVAAVAGPCCCVVTADCGA
jgi:hypothetical protein